MHLTSFVKQNFIIVSVLFLSLPMMTHGLSPNQPQTGSTPSVSSLVFGPEYHFDEHFIGFFNPKNADFKDRYFLENSLACEAAFFSVNQRSFFFGEVIVNFDMGRQEGAILLDPREVDMGFGPLFEYRTDRAILQAGLDHHCFHQIDRGEWNTLYWNKLFFSAGSLNMREGAYRERLLQCDTIDWVRRLSWQAGYGLFVHEFFGLLDTNALSWGNAYIHELSLSARWTFLQNGAYALFATGESRARIDRGGRWLWTEAMGCELTTLKGEFGLSLFLNWIVSDRSIERENRDRLVEAGFRVFK
jgi:hypothetical protein